MKRLLILIAISLIILTILFIYQSISSNDQKLHIVFCNVGQGDSVLLKTPGRRYILYDGGPDKSVLGCLQRHLSFWERTLSMIFLSHPHSDHFSGLYFVLDRYNALSFNSERLSNQSLQFKSFLTKIWGKKIPGKDLLAGDLFRTPDGVVIRVLGPDRAYLEETSPGGTIGEKSEFASLILLVSYGSFDLLLTGDSQARGVARGIERAVDSLPRGSIEAIQVPHHGSATGLDDEVIDKIAPKLAVISVGKNNYGHPSKSIIELLRNKGIKTLRTDQHGDVEIVSDGKRWSVK